MSKAAVKVELVRERGGPFTDTLYGTGVTWSDIGDVREVPAEKWSQMKRHADVWREAVESEPGPAPEPAPAPAPAPEPPAPPAAGDVTDMLSFGDMSDEQVRAFLASQDLKVDGRLKGDRLKEAALAAYQEKVAAGGAVDATGAPNQGAA